ncbi:two component response regulator PilR [Legionella quinlivanii]|uniref:Two component response regulator PilR n=2 Tax=Legionella quinlivanii TaxID=45073 RepID=A0A0W0Y4G9_9GAMM|nr:sigma-54 dependent transcriptional regulator [Legionella quinlivanii]KTD51616.1 two component response regulator PilR [Legionella quinlivanii]SEF60829.1 two-component system, NtrC family, response regulator PilR [Legionella quinlivanii DSM 21216]STY10857.1 two-component system response regulator PilR [Legionella quinlivanii]
MMNKTTILIIDDEPDIRELLSLTLNRMQLSCDTAGSYEEAITRIKQHDYSLILSDMRLPDGEGIEIVHFVQQHKPHIPIAVITAYGNVEGAVNTLKAGAFDYISKPINLQMLKDLVKTALSIHKESANFPRDQIIGESDSIEELRQNINKLARSQAPVFILGESGVGKELVAQLIHHQGPRAEKPFIAVNCGAIPAELMESEFFGHRKGSFTGAIADKTGLFVAANGGTLFLDEIAELPLPMQVKLLRAIQEKAIKPIGDYNEVSVDVRILSASHKSLHDEIQAGRFRQDLYYRVNVIELRVPPLRERLDDIPLLASHILKKIALVHKQRPIAISKTAIAALQTYQFPGNVRELENILERAMALCEGDTIHVSDLNLPQAELPPVKKETPDSYQDLDNTLHEQQKEMILKALEKTKWNRTAAAKLLGISFRTLRYRLKKLGLD